MKKFAFVLFAVLYVGASIYVANQYGKNIQRAVDAYVSTRKQPQQVNDSSAWCDAPPVDDAGAPAACN